MRIKIPHPMREEMDAMNVAEEEIAPSAHVVNAETRKIDADAQDVKIVPFVNCFFS